MFRFVTIALATSMFLASGMNGRAAPITYEFSGNFNQPMNGSTQFSGSFTFNPDPTQSNVGMIGVIQDAISTVGSVSVAQPTAYGFTPFPASGSQPGIAEFGTDLSLTVTMGGQTIHHVNTSANQFADFLTAGYERLYPPNPNFPDFDGILNRSTQEGK